MRILFIGDIVGKLGRRAVGEVLPNLRKKEKIDLVVANGENLAHGRGVTEKTLKEVIGYGVDLFTSGPHIFAHEEIFDINPPLIRPANYPSGKPGKGFTTLKVTGKDILIINLVGAYGFLGRKFLEEDEEVENPFPTMEQILKSQEKTDLTIVDFHAEITSEKRALGFFLDGKVTAVLGTHTHVPTADAQVLPKGTGYVTDTGMCGAKDSVLGVSKETIIRRLAEGIKDPFEWVEKGLAVFNSVLLEVNSKGLVKKITRVDRVID